VNIKRTKQCRPTRRDEASRQQTTDRQADRQTGADVMCGRSRTSGEASEGHYSLASRSPGPFAGRRTCTLGRQRARWNMRVGGVERGRREGEDDWLAVCVQEAYTLQAVIIVEGLPLL
jgi:hypothetical protein